jgi:hypothetical protein
MKRRRGRCMVPSDPDNVEEDHLWRTVNDGLATLIAAMEQELGRRTGDRT